MSDSAFPGPRPLEFDAAFWEGAKNDRLMVQQCSDCEAFVYPPRVQCPRCSGELVWQETEGSGTVYTYGVVHRPNRPAYFDGQLPIILAVVELTEGPRVVTDVVDCSPDEISVGDDVEVTFDDVTDDVTLPKFRIA